MGNDEANIMKVQGCDLPTGCQTVTAVKLANPDVAKIEETIIYTIVVKNDMNYPIEDIIVKDEIPAGLALVAGSTKVDGITVADTIETGLKIKQIASKGKATVTFEVTVVSADTNPKINIAEVAYTTIVGASSIEGKTTTNPVVVNIVGAKIIKAFTPNVATKGDVLICTITVTSLAESSKNVITDQLPPELELVDHTINVSGKVIVGDITEGIDIGPIPKGQTRTVTFKVKVK
ncbi:MAG: DUF11 domain-containing protein [Cellulosilyticaceae bacterium]